MVTKYTLRGLIITGALLTAACGDDGPVVSTPPAAWVEPVPEPTVPAGNSDEEVANYIVSLFDAMRAANNKLQRLKRWREGIED